MSEVVNMFGLVPPRILPDHSILSGSFVTSFYDSGKNFENKNKGAIESQPNHKPNKKAKKNLTKIDQSFFLSEDTFNKVLFTVGRLEKQINTKTEIDTLWLEVKQIFLSEMATLPDLPTSTFKKQNQKFKKSKSFWNPELENLWSQACIAEKLYLGFRVQSNRDIPWKNKLRTDFKNIQKHFDKKFRYFQRQKKKKDYCDLETNAKSRPALMWEQLKRLDNPPSTRAALEIVTADESISHDLN